MSEARTEQSHGGNTAKRGGAITVAGQGAKLCVQFASLVVFSRLLSPTDFGLVAMLTLFVGLGELVRDFGLSQAALQARSLSRAQVSNLFWINVGVSVGLAAGFYAALPLIEDLFEEPELSQVGHWMALLFVLNGLQAQAFVELARGARFTAMAASDVGAQMIGFAVGVAVAVGGGGYWALVVQLLVAAAVLGTSRWVLARFRPGRPSRGADMGKLYRYGLQLGAAQLLGYGSSNADNYIVGMRWGAAQLGIYSRAFQLVSVPVSQLLAPLTNAVLPLLSAQRHEHGDAHVLLLKAQVALSAVFTLPFVAAATVADPLVRGLLGSEWAAAAPIVQVLLWGGCVQVLNMVAYWAFLTAGLTRELLYYNLLTKPLHIGCIVVGSFGGLRGVAIGYVVGLVLSWPISLAWLVRYDRLPWRPFVRHAAHVFGAGALAGLLSAAVYSEVWHSAPSFVASSIAVVVAAVSYVGVIAAIPSTRIVLVGFTDTWRLTRQQRHA